MSFQNSTTSENPENVSKNMIVGPQSPLVSLLKPGLFLEKSIYILKEETSAHLPMKKSQLRVFFEKIDLLTEEEGP